MKIKLTLLSLLFLLTASAQYKAKINPYKRIFTICKDTLYAHTAFNQPTQYAVYKLSYLKYRGKIYRYKIAYFDPSLYWAEQSQCKKQIKLY